MGWLLEAWRLVAVRLVLVMAVRLLVAVRRVVAVRLLVAVSVAVTMRLVVAVSLEAVNVMSVVWVVALGVAVLVLEQQVTWEFQQWDDR